MWSDLLSITECFLWWETVSNAVLFPSFHSQSHMISPANSSMSHPLVYLYLSVLCNCPVICTETLQMASLFRLTVGWSSTHIGVVITWRVSGEITWALWLLSCRFNLLSCSSSSRSAASLCSSLLFKHTYQNCKETEQQVRNVSEFSVTVRVKGQEKTEGVTATFGPNSQLSVNMLQQRMRTLVRQNWTGGLWVVSSEPNTPDTLNTITTNILSVRCLLLTAGWSTCAVQMLQARKHPRPWRRNTTFHLTNRLTDATFSTSNTFKRGRLQISFLITAVFVFLITTYQPLWVVFDKKIITTNMNTEREILQWENKPVGAVWKTNCHESLFLNYLELISFFDIFLLFSTDTLWHWRPSLGGGG